MIFPLSFRTATNLPVAHPELTFLTAMLDNGTSKNSNLMKLQKGSCVIPKQIDVNSSLPKIVSKADNLLYHDGTWICPKTFEIA